MQRYWCPSRLGDAGWLAGDVYLHPGTADISAIWGCCRQVWSQADSYAVFIRLDCSHSIQYPYLCVLFLLTVRVSLLIEVVHSPLPRGLPITPHFAGGIVYRRRWRPFCPQCHGLCHLQRRVDRVTEVSYDIDELKALWQGRLHAVSIRHLLPASRSKYGW